MLPVHNQGLGELAYRCSWMEKGYCHMVRATAERRSAAPSETHGVSMAVPPGGSCRWKFNGTYGTSEGSEGIPFWSFCVRIDGRYCVDFAWGVFGLQPRCQFACRPSWDQTYGNQLAVLDKSLQLAHHSEACFTSRLPAHCPRWQVQSLKLL